MIGAWHLKNPLQSIMRRFYVRYLIKGSVLAQRVFSGASVGGS